MKKISKLVLVVFSVIILLIGVAVNLLIVGWLDYETAFSLIRRALSESPSNKIILIFTELSMLFAILCIFLDSSSKGENKPSGRDVLMQNDNGKLMISRETIENLVNGVVKEFPGARQAQTRIALDAQNNVDVLVDLTVTKDVVIKELTANMQTRIKEAIKKTSDLDVKEVNVKIKDIYKEESDK
jgi:uncharacterized alkaline shock family protein YloU